MALLHSQSLTDQEGLTATDDLTRDPTAWCPGVGGDLREVGLLLAPLHSGSANSGHVGWYSTHSLHPGKAPIRFILNPGFADEKSGSSHH